MKTISASTITLWVIFIFLSLIFVLAGYFYANISKIGTNEIIFKIPDYSFNQDNLEIESKFYWLENEKINIKIENVIKNDVEKIKKKENIIALNQQVLSLLADLTLYKNSLDLSDPKDILEYEKIGSNILFFRDLNRFIANKKVKNGAKLKEFFGEKIKDITDKGDVKVFYTEPKADDYKVYYTHLQETKFFTKEAKKINQLFKLDNDIYIIFSECRNKKQYKNNINICLKTFKEIEKIESKNFTDQFSLQKSSQSIIKMIIFARLGEVLLDMYEIKYLGRKIETLDQFAVFFNKEFFSKNQQDFDFSIKSYAAFLKQNFNNQIAENSETKTEKQDESNQKENGLSYFFLSNPHSIGPKRYYNILCLHFGQNPDIRNPYLNFNTEEIDENKLTIDSAITCSEEYLRSSNFWYRKLSPYFK